MFHRQMRGIAGYYRLSIWRPAFMVRWGPVMQLLQWFPAMFADYIK